MLRSEERSDHRLVLLDAGPRNVLDREAVEALREALAPDAARPVVVLRGRADGFCAGLDGRVLAAGGDEAEALLAAMGRLLADLLAGPTRLVTVCEGHAVAAGAMLLLVADVRLALPGRYRIGFTEPTVGLPLPELPALLARERLDRRRLHALTVLGETVDPRTAAAAGFLDAVLAPRALDVALRGQVTRLASLSPEVYAGSVHAVHGALIERVEALARAQETRARGARRKR